MTGRTHDLAAFTLLNLVMATQPIPTMTLATAVVSLGGNMIGGLIPDIDHPASEFWQRIPAGSIFGRIIHPLLGSHRMISHSLLGIVLAGWGLTYALKAISSVLLVDMTVVWWAIMIGYASHLLADTVTVDGVPYLFPVPIRFGIPPIKAFRVKTGGIVEKSVIFPGLMILNGYLLFSRYPTYVELIKKFIR